jgi:hypothetical protein
MSFSKFSKESKDVVFFSLIKELKRRQEEKDLLSSKRTEYKTIMTKEEWDIYVSSIQGSTTIVPCFESTCCNISSFKHFEPSLTPRESPPVPKEPDEPPPSKRFVQIDEKYTHIETLMDLIQLIENNPEDNEIQYNILCLLRDKLDIKINLIGDPNQNIYQFQNGSDQYLMKHPGKTYNLIKLF